MGDPMPFAALACLSAIINLGSVVRLVGYALPRGLEMRCRPWQVAICCISYLASLAMAYKVESTYGSVVLLLELIQKITTNIAMLVLSCCL
jgi:hypothetical protein